MKKYLYDDERGTVVRVRAKFAYNAAKSILRKTRLYTGTNIYLQGGNGKYQCEYPIQVGLRKSLDNIFFKEIN